MCRSGRRQTRRSGECQAADRSYRISHAFVTRDLGLMSALASEPGVRLVHTSFSMHTYRSGGVMKSTRQAHERMNRVSNFPSGLGACTFNRHFAVPPRLTASAYLINLALPFRTRLLASVSIAHYYTLCFDQNSLEYRMQAVEIIGIVSCIPRTSGVPYIYRKLVNPILESHRQRTSRRSTFPPTR